MSNRETNVRVRRMHARDINRVMAIAESLTHAPHWSRDIYERALTPAGIPERIALIAEADGEITGFLVASLIPPETELETIAVEAVSQKRGIGIRLFGELLAELSARQVTEVMLEVRESNAAARAFYGSLGFAETGRRRGYYSDPQEDGLLLRRPVPWTLGA